MLIKLQKITVSAQDGAFSVADWWFRSVFLVVFVFSVFLVVYRIDEPPWEGKAHAFVFSEYPHYAYNYLRYGYTKSYLAPIMNYGDDVPLDDFKYRITHGNVLPLLTSISYTFFGVNAWSARLVPILGAIGLSIAIFLLTLRLTNNRWSALLAFVFCSFMPIYTFYARLPGPHMLATTFSVVTFLFYWQWLSAKESKWLFAMFFVLLIGMWTDWIAYFVVPALLFHYLLFVPGGKKKRFVFYISGLSVANFCIYVFWVFILSGNALIEALKEQFLYRTSFQDLDGHFSLMDYMVLSVNRAINLATPVIFVASVVCLIFVVSRFFNGKLSGVKGFILALWLFGVLHNLVFPNRVYFHEFIAFYHLVPAFSISSAFIIGRLVEKPKFIHFYSLSLILFSFLVNSLFVYREMHKESIPYFLEWYYASSKVREILPSDRIFMISSDEVLENNPIFFANADRRYYTLRDYVYDSSDYWSKVDMVVISNKNALEGLLIDDLVYNWFRCDVGGFSIFTRDNKDGCFESVLPVEYDPEIHKNIVFGDHLELLGYDSIPVIYRGDESISLFKRYLNAYPELLPQYRTKIRITTYWRKLNQQSIDYELGTRLTHGNDVLLMPKHAEFFNLYPTSRWPINQVIRMETEIDIPRDVPPGKYDLWIGVNIGWTGLAPDVDAIPMDSGARILLDTVEVRSSLLDK